MGSMPLRVLTWNLFHGRSVPPAGRELFDEFAGLLGRWEWDVALLQEVPPWWPQALAARLGCDNRLALTSRNAVPALRRAAAVRWPDLVKSNGGGANAILVRAPYAIAGHQTLRLSLLPERRWLHAVRLTRGVWVGNVHAAADPRQSRRAAAALRSWAGGSPAVLGGDFNVAPLSLDGFTLAGGYEMDQVFVTDELAAEPGSRKVLERGDLSDHAPVAVTVA